MVECREGYGCHLEESEEHEFPEDSDYESERELAGNPISGNPEVGCEEKRGQKILPVLGVGSLAA